MQRLVSTAEHILAVYHVEASQPLEEAAIRAGVQFSSTFVPVPGETGPYAGARRRNMKPHRDGIRRS